VTGSRANRKSFRARSSLLGSSNVRTPGKSDDRTECQSPGHNQRLKVEFALPKRARQFAGLPAQKPSRLRFVLGLRGHDLRRGFRVTRYRCFWAGQRIERVLANRVRRSGNRKPDRNTEVTQKGRVRKSGRAEGLHTSLIHTQNDGHGAFPRHYDAQEDSRRTYSDDEVDKEP